MKTDILASIKKRDRKFLAKNAGVDEGVIKRILMGDQVKLTDFIKVTAVVNISKQEAEKYWIDQIQSQRVDIITNLLLSRCFTRSELVLFTKKKLSLFRPGKGSYGDDAFYNTITFLESFPPVRELLQKHQRENHLTDAQVAELLDVNVTRLQAWYNGRKPFAGLRRKCYDLMGLTVEEPPVITTSSKINRLNGQRTDQKVHKSQKRTRKPAQPKESAPNPFILNEVTREERLKKHVDLAFKLAGNAELLDALGQIESDKLELGFLLKLSEDFKSYV